MSFRLTGILALAAAFLGLLIVFWEQDDDTVRARLEQARRAFRFDPARVDRLRIENGDLVLECRLDGRQWYMEKPIAARADPIAIERLLGALQELPRGDILLPPRRATNAYAPYGLDIPHAAISIIEDSSSTNRILIGRRTPLGDGVYVRQSDQAGLARLDPSLLDLLPASADALRDRSLLSGAPAAIDRLDIRGPSGYLQLGRASHNGWRLYQPYTARADSATVAALVEQLLACDIVQFVQDAVGDLSPYGLDSQSAVTAVLNTDTGDGSQMLSFGDPLPNDSSLVYARLQAENSVYAVSQDVRQALLLKPDDLRDRRLPGVDSDSILSVRVEAKETVLNLLQNDDDTWLIAAPLRAPGDSETIRNLLSSWADVRLVSFENAATSPPPSEWTRTLRVASRDPRAADVVFHVAPHPGDTNLCRIEIAGESSIAVASPPRLLDFPLDPLAYRSRDILSVPSADVERVRIATADRTVQIDRDLTTDQWVPAAPWIDGLLAVLDPLRAEAILPADQSPADDAFANPHLTVTLDLRGQSGLATTLRIGPETVPGGSRLATVRGRDLVFALPSWTVEALTPPAAETP